MRLEINRQLHKKIMQLIEDVEIENNKISTYNAYSLRDTILDQIILHLNEHYTYNEDAS
jgi:hypothetical protein